MKTGLESLNLRPMEKRLVVVVAIVMFIVLNFWLVFPHFGDWSRLQSRKDTAETKLQNYRKQVDQIPVLKGNITRLEGDAPGVPPEEQSIHFSGAIQREQARSGVSILRTGRINTRTNQFFLEQSATVSVESGEEQLVNFLYNLGASNSLIRVRDLTVRPDQARQKLVSEVKLVASYQKSAARPATTPTRPGTKGGTRKTSSVATTAGK